LKSEHLANKPDLQWGLNNFDYNCNSEKSQSVVQKVNRNGSSTEPWGIHIIFRIYCNTREATHTMASRLDASENKMF